MSGDAKNEFNEFKDVEQFTFVATYAVSSSSEKKDPPPCLGH